MFGRYNQNGTSSYVILNTGIISEENELPLGLFKTSAHLMTEFSYLGFYLRNKFNF